MIVLNRAPHAPAAIGYVSGFNLQDGAFGSTIAHDSHNLIVTGSSDELIVQAANRLIAMQGGIVCCDRDTTTEMPLPVGGLMSDGSRDGHPAIRPDRTAYPRTGLSLLHSGHAARLPGSSGDPVAQAHRPGTLRRDPVRICLNKAV